MFINVIIYLLNVSMGLEIRWTDILTFNTYRVIEILHEKMFHKKQIIRRMQNC